MSQCVCHKVLYLGVLEPSFHLLWDEQSHLGVSTSDGQQLEQVPRHAVQRLPARQLVLHQLQDVRVDILLHWWGHKSETHIEQCTTGDNLMKHPEVYPTSWLTAFLTHFDAHQNNVMFSVEFQVCTHNMWIVKSLVHCKTLLWLYSIQVLFLQVVSTLTSFVLLFYTYICNPLQK